MKLKVGTKVTIDLWDPQKKQGIAKHFGDTLDLVHAESEFDLKKGDTALVIKSFEGHVQLIPIEPKFAKIIQDGTLNIDLVGLTHLIYDYLKFLESTTGGIISTVDLLDYFTQTPLKDFIHEEQLKKAAKVKDLPFEYIKYGKVRYFALHPADIVDDKQKLLALSQKYDFITIDILQKQTGWIDFRIQRMLDYLVSAGRCRIETTYREGYRYFFIKP